MFWLFRSAPDVSEVRDAKEAQGIRPAKSRNRKYSFEKHKEDMIILIFAFAENSQILLNLLSKVLW